MDNRQGPLGSAARLFGAVLLMSTLAVGAASADETVVVVTANHTDIMTRIEEAFEKAHPGIKVDYQWRSPGETVEYLRKPGIKADVYWSPSPQNFARLKASHALAKLDIDHSKLPAKLGPLWISDPDDFFAAYEIAGFVIAVNPAGLAAHNLPAPTSWAELADPRYAGHEILPSPRVGYAPPLYELMLESMGWQKGWEVILGMAANSELSSVGPSVPEEIAAGRQDLGPVMDFFAVSAAAGGAKLTYTYPTPNTYPPAHVAILASAPHPAAAKAFVDYVLSAEGQRLLYSPDVRKLPVRPEIYADAPAGTHDPFKTTVFAYDQALGVARRGEVAALFDAFTSDDSTLFGAVWTGLRAAKVDAATLAKARALALWLPVDEALSRDERVTWPFLQHGSPPDAEARTKAWAAAIADHYRQAADLLGVSPK